MVIPPYGHYTIYCQNSKFIFAQFLSPSEYRLLLHLMQNKGRTVTREPLLSAIWNTNETYVSNNTLSVTVKRLRAKLHQPACLKTVHSVGYRMEDSEKIV